MVFYMLFVYSVTCFKQVMHVQAAQALDINTINMLILLLLMLLAGALSDRLGRKPLLIASALGTLVLAWPLFWLMHHPSFALMLAGQMGFAVLLGVFLWVGPAAMVEVFPARVRCSAYSVGYNLTLGLLGGTTPMVATYLIARSHDDLSKPRQHFVSLSVHVSRPCWVDGSPLISMLGLSHVEDTFCLYAAPLLIKPRPIE